MRVRLQDVAKLAGVSMKTVSNVVRNQPHVRPEMRARVQKAIDELGYVPNGTARRLATGRTGMIALAFPALDVPYFAELAERLSRQAKAQQLHLLIEQTESQAAAERQVLNGREAGLVDGLIFQPMKLNSTEIATLRGSLPVVLLGEVVPPLSVDQVMIDNIAAACTATEHLIDQGRSRIGFLGHEDTYRSNTVSRRLIGYQQALESRLLPIRTDLLLGAKDYGTAAAEEAVRVALQAGIELDGLVCYDDLTAIGALRGLRRAGVSVPGDIAVVGWDDIALAEYMNPGLTTIAPDLDALASRALGMLIERIAGYDGPGRHELVGYQLVARESSTG
ncbi:LacI family DNA-binding transcriptional regulator [Nonomuraea jabiensis]|uniref:LacI family DNA-binding transcriptional regulator n=1 Tax=Nonomuraea jabiensis TaxID=882448 RepID=UPI003678D827